MTQDPNVTPHDHDLFDNLAPPSSPGLAPPASHVETLKATDTAAAEVIKAPRDLAPPSSPGLAPSASHEPEVALGAAKAASSELHTLLHNVGNAAEMPLGEMRRLAHQLFEALGKLL